MMKRFYFKVIKWPMGVHILIVMFMMLLMFFIGMCIGFILNHQNPLNIFEYQTWYHFKQIFGG